MTPTQASLVQHSFARVGPTRESGGLSCHPPFEIGPGTRPLSARTDRAAQGQTPMTTLGFVVARLGRPARVVPAAQALARRHVGSGVTEAQCAGVALLRTLGQGLGEAFAPELEAAWTAAQTLPAGVMSEAAVQDVVASARGA